jgi:hypothetical protein
MIFMIHLIPMIPTTQKLCAFASLHEKKITPIKKIKQITVQTKIRENPRYPCRPRSNYCGTGSPARQSPLPAFAEALAQAKRGI